MRRGNDLRAGCGVRRAAAALLLAALAPGPTAATPSRNLYEWMAIAPVIVAGHVTVDDARYVEFQVAGVLRGDIVPGALLRIDQRRANRDRAAGTASLSLERHQEYLVLLEPRRSGKASARGTYDLVRGTAGARELPAEGTAAWLDAAHRLAEVQGRKDDELAWQAFGEMLSDPNPILVDTALEMLVKFRRAEPPLLPRLRLLLGSSRSAVRRHALELVGQVAEGRPPEELPDAEGLLVEVIARARRDDVPDVRRAAVAALGAFPGDRTDTVLRRIAREDPEQDVRYQAERVLYERSTGRDGARRKEG